MSSFLSIIIDCNPLDWSSVISTNPGIDIYEQIISTIIAVSNSHLFASLNNRLLVIPGRANLDNKKFSNDQYFHESNEIPSFIKSLENFLRETIMNDCNYQWPINSQYSAAISLSICAFQKFRRQFHNSTGSIIIINLAKNLSIEQNLLMNLFFASKHCSLPVNVASITPPIPILQQACDITGGIHMTIDNPKLLAQNLLVRIIIIIF